MSLTQHQHATLQALEHGATITVFDRPNTTYYVLASTPDTARIIRSDTWGVLVKHGYIAELPAPSEQITRWAITPRGRHHCAQDGGQ